MKVFWFDTETSGLDEKKNGIISIAYVIEIDGEVEASGELYSNCTDKQIEDGALKVNGFTRDQIESFPPPKEMYDQLSKILAIYVDKFDRSDKFVAAGYNVQFDVRFLRQLWYDSGDKYFGSWFAYGVIDPSQVLRFLEYAGDSFVAGGKLTEVAARLGIATEGAHTALSDVYMAMNITKELLRGISKPTK
jgi:DNA polymerase-3 subunit epsilon